MGGRELGGRGGVGRGRVELGGGGGGRGNILCGAWYGVEGPSFRKTIWFSSPIQKVFPTLVQYRRPPDSRLDLAMSRP